jgi:hypothetical protein
VPPPAPGITPAPSLSRAVAASAPPVETSRPKKRKARKTKPVEDEWGIFDPRRAGVEALIAALEAKEQEESEEDSEEDGPSPPAALPTPERRLAPLSRWALSDSGSPEPTTQPRPTDDLRALLDGLAVPAHVASVSYPTGCRIRRVRMSKDPEHRNKKAADEPVIILSRRALGRSVPEKDDTGPLTSR